MTRRNGRQCQNDGVDLAVVLGAHFQNEPALAGADAHPERTFGPARRGEPVLLQQVEDGDPALVVDVGVAPDEAVLVERDVDDPMMIGHGPQDPVGPSSFRRMVSDNA